MKAAVHTITFTARPFYPDELQLLQTVKTEHEKAGAVKVKVSHFLVAGIAGAIFTYLAVQAGNSFWVLPFGTLAVLAFAFILFTPYQLYQLRKSRAAFLRQLNRFIDTGTVDTCFIHASNIAFAGEYEDEGDLYLVAYDTDKVLYLWDSDDSFPQPFPCLRFDVYEPAFYAVSGRQLYPLSDRMKPLLIDKKAKWDYMTHAGVTDHLQVDVADFDALVEAYRKGGVM